MRLFLGIEIPTEIKHRLQGLAEPLRPLAKLSWSPVENLHVTIKFIGEWPEDRLQTVKDAVAGVPVPGAFEIAVRGLGWFPNARNPRVFWAGIEADVAQALVPAVSRLVSTPPEPSVGTSASATTESPLAQLAKDTDAALAAIGVPAENHEYHPHLTLARRRNPVPIEALRKAAESLPNIDFGAFRASSFFLYLSAAGKYTKLQEYRLC